MAAQSGFSYILKTPTDAQKAVQDAPPDKADFTQIGGLQSNDDSPSIDLIETTNKSSAQNQEFLEGRGVLRLNINGNGVLQKDVLTNEIYRSFLDKKHRWIMIEREDGFVTIAKCAFANFNQTGENTGAVQFSFTLQSSGIIYQETAAGIKWNSGSRKYTNFQTILNPFKYQKFLSPAYDLATIPVDKQTPFKADLTAKNLLNADNLDGDPATAIDFTGNVANKYVFPIFLILESELANRKLQVLDSMDLPVTPRFIGDFDDDIGVTMRAYYLDFPLGNTETTEFKIQLWN